MRAPEELGDAADWHLRQNSASATATTLEPSESLRREDDAALPHATSQDEQDKWLCARLRELYASGSFWHVSAKLAADRIESLLAERDCAVAAFDLERAAHDGGQDPAVVDCERQRDGSFAPAARLPATPVQIVPGQLPPGQPPRLPAPLAPELLDLTPQWPLEVTEQEVEAAARILCEHNGVDPDEPVLYRDHKGVRVRRTAADEDAGRCSAMPVWKWRFEKPARAALEAAATARPRPFGLAPHDAPTEAEAEPASGG